MASRTTGVFAIVFAITLLTAPVMAQTVTGTINGTVFDSTNAVMPGAAITATNSATNFSRTTKSDELGNYLLTFLPPGDYRVNVSNPGFKAALRAGVTVQADERVRLDFTLEVGEASQTVEVTAGAPLVQTSDATVGEVVDSRHIADLPLNKRNFVDLVQLTSGVTPGRPGEFGGETTIDNFRGRFSFSANGQRSTTNNFMLDGVDNNANLFNAGGVVIAPVVDAIQEFKVSTANFSPEFGRATGGVLSVQTKAGTNQLHGTLFEFLRNSAFDANSFFNNRAGVDKPAFRQNQFGFTAGGPVIKDKTFFFGDYQGFRVRDSRTFLSSVPLPAAREGDFSSPVYQRIYDPATAVADGSGLRLTPFPNNRIPAQRFDPVAREAISLYPPPNTNQGSIASNFLNNPNLTRNDDQFDIRIDQRLPDSSSFFVRYSYGNADQLWPNAMLSAENPFGGGGKGNDSTVRTQAVTANYIRSLTPRWLSETRLGFTRTYYIGEPLGANNPAFDRIVIPNQRYSDLIQTIPTFSVSRLTGIGPQGNVPNVSVLNSYQLSQNIIASLGARHTLKFGGDLIRRQLNNNFTGSPSGAFSFTGAYTNANARVSATGGEPFADFLLGLPGSANRDILLGGFGRRDIVAALYLQDDMKATRRLTVNIGVRWDLWTPFYEVNDRQSNFDIGAGKLVMASPDGPLGRGLRQTNWKNIAPRFGFAYDLDGKGQTVLRGGYSISYLEDLSAGKTILALNPPFAFGDQITNSQGIIPQLGLKDGFMPPAIPPIDSRLSGTVKMTDPGYATTYSQSWSFEVQRQIGGNFVAEAGYVGTKGTHLMERIDGNQPLPGPGQVAAHRPFYALYPNLGTLDGLLSTANSSYHSLQLKLTKRFANGLSFLAAYTYGRAIEGSEGVGETGVGSSITTMAQDPLNRRAEKALASFDMRQRFVFSYTYELPFGKGKAFLTSGAGAALAGGWRVQGVTTLLGGEPLSVVMASSSLNTGTFQRPNRVCDGALPVSERSIDRWFDTSCFVAPPAFTYGNAGRNILIGPGAVNFDVSAARDIRLAERAKVEFRAEFFNFSNTPQFYPPNSSVGSKDFGTISGVRGGSNRQIQFGLKVLY